MTRANAARLLLPRRRLRLCSPGRRQREGTRHCCLQRGLQLSGREGIFGESWTEVVKRCEVFSPWIFSSVLFLFPSPSPNIPANCRGECQYFFLTFSVLVFKSTTSGEIFLLDGSRLSLIPTLSCCTAPVEQPRECS